MTDRGLTRCSKVCAACDAPLSKRKGESEGNWQRRKTCGLECGYALLRYTPERRAASFWAKVNKTDSCWLWTAYRNWAGYGLFKFGPGLVNVHRISWQYRHGEIPEGMHVLHKCDVRNCVNPDHLFLGTHQDNMNDKGLKGRQAGRQLTPSATARAASPIAAPS